MDIGKLVAFQAEDGHVYTGIVESETNTAHQFNVNILGDGEYRSAGYRK